MPKESYEFISEEKENFKLLKVGAQQLKLAYLPTFIFLFSALLACYGG